MDADDNVGGRIISGGIWRLIGFGLATLLSVLAMAVVSRELGPADFALFTTAYSLVALATLIPDFGLVALGVREFTVLEGEERVRSQRALIALRLGFSIIVSVVVVGFSVIADYPSNVVLGVALASVGVCALSLSSSYLVPLQALYKLRLVAIMELLRQSLIAALMIAAVLSVSEPGFVIAAYLPAGVVIAFLLALVTRQLAPILPSLDFLMMGRLLRKVSSFAVAGVVGAAYAYVLQILSNSILDAHDAGLFGLVFRIYISLLAAGMTAISGAFPLLVNAAKEDPKRLAYAMRRMLQTALVTGVAATVALVGGAEFVIRAVGGAEFAGAESTLAIVAFAVPWSLILVSGSMYMLAADHHKALVLISVLGAAISVGLTAALTAAFGLHGTAAGLVIGEFVIACGYLTKIARVQPLALPRMRFAAGTIALGLVSCLAALLPLPSLVNGVIGAGFFLVVAFVTKLIPPELTSRVATIEGDS